MNTRVMISGVALLTAAIAGVFLTSGLRNSSPPDTHVDAFSGASMEDSPLHQGARSGSTTGSATAGLPAQSQTSPSRFTQARPAPDRETLARAIMEETQRRQSPEALAKLRQTFEEEHAYLGKALDLAPDEVKQVLDMMARHNAERDLAYARMQVNSDESGEYQRLTRSQTEEMQALLGSKHDRLRAYPHFQQQLLAVERFQDVFGPDANPVSERNTYPLVAALAAEQLRIDRDMQLVPAPSNRPTSAALREQLEWTQRYVPENNRRMMAAASPYLNAGQLTDYGDMLQGDFNDSLASIRRNITRLEGQGL